MSYFLGFLLTIGIFIAIIVSFGLILFGGLIFIRCISAAKRRRKVEKAIIAYMRQCREPAHVTLDDMESFRETVYRLWDWGYDYILKKPYKMYYIKQDLK